MTKKTKVSPKVKHKAFASFSTRLQDNDWMIGIYNPNDHTACYFLAEPSLPNKTEYQVKAPANKHSGYVVSALNRQGLAESTFTGLPRKFKAVEDAMEWLENQIEQYEGDKMFPIGEGIDAVAASTKTFEEAFAATGYQYGEDALEQVRLGWELATKKALPMADFKSDGELNNNDLEYQVSMQNFANQVEHFAKESVKSPGKSGAVTGKAKTNVERGEAIHAEIEKKFVKNGKEIKPRSTNGTKSTKTAHADAPYVKPASKFKTSKEELKSLGLDKLFD